MDKTSFLDRIIYMLGFPFRGPQWGTKLLLGSLLCAGSFLIPVVPVFFVYGYVVRIMRMVLNGEEASLPEWDNWGELFVEGAKLWAAGIIYSLPVLLLMLAATASLVLPWIYALFNPVTLRTGTFPQESIQLLLVGTIISFAGMCVTFPIGLILSCLQKPAISHLVTRRSFSAAFQFREWWPILRAGFGGFVLVIVVDYFLALVGTFLLQMLNLTIILAFLSPLTFGAYLLLIILYGQALAALAYREGKRMLEGKSA